MQHIIIAKIPSVINSVLWVESVESPGPVAYAHRQRSAALRAKTKQPDLYGRSTTKQPDLYGRSTTFAPLRLCAFALISSSSRISAGDPLRAGSEAHARRWVIGCGGLGKIENRSPLLQSQ